MRRRDTIQNITITLLAVSAIALFSQTQFFQLGTSAASGYWQRLTATAATGSDSAPLSDTLSAPVRTAVTGAYGRYGNVSLTTGSEEFIPIKTLLREVLGSARSQTGSSQSALQSALTQPSVYCDFLSPLPISYLAELMGVGMDSGLEIRALAAAEREDQVVLLLWDGAESYYQYATAVQPAALAEVLEQYELGVSAFAFEESDGYGSHLSPLCLFPDALPELAQVSVGEASVSTDDLLTALGFNPHTNSRYLDASGTEVVVEGDRVVRLSASGAFSYTSGGETSLAVEAVGGVPTAREAASGVQALLERLIPAGDGRLYLLSLEQSGEETRLTFGYHLNGVPIRFTDGSPAGEVILSGSAVAALYLQPRQYLAEDSVSALLPLRQAMAIAAGEEGRELSIGYADHGAYPLSAVWLAD